MSCVGGGRFLVVAGPDACVDRPESVAALRKEAARAGLEIARTSTGGGATRFEFALDAGSPAGACEGVTELFRAIYGLNWWAEVTALCGEQSPAARAARWNE